MKCSRKRPPYGRLLALYRYQAPFDRVLHALKFQAQHYLADAIGAALWDRFGEQLAASDCVVPVPLPWTRRMQRGFNQSEAIGSAVAARLGLPLVRALRRKPSPPQSHLDESQRRHNATRSFGPAGPRHLSQIEGGRVLLLDDVVTTGATVTACARLLLRYGAERVSVLAAALRPWTA